MKYANENERRLASSFSGISRQSLRVDCKECFGLCCVALYFSASEGFPVDKEAGKPCLNLQSDFCCSVHKDLRELGLKGCTAYDCFGAGQKVSQVVYGGHSWQQAPASAKQMYEVFLIMRQIHEMLWYLTEALILESAYSIKGELNAMLKELESLTFLSPSSLIELDMAAQRAAVNALLLQTSELVRAQICPVQRSLSRHKKTLGKGLDLIGADLRKTELRGENLRAAYLIAANLRGVDLNGVDFLGADLRDADLRGADLSNSIFLTQAQINTAKGDSHTKLPVSLARPAYWSK